MPFFGQDIWITSEASAPFSYKTYLDAVKKNKELAGEKGIDLVLQKNKLDALIAPTGGPAWLTDYVNGTLLHLLLQDMHTLQFQPDLFQDYLSDCPSLRQLTVNQP